MKKHIKYIALFGMLTSLCFAGETTTSVAKVDYDELDEILEKIVLASPGNEELGKRFLAKKKADKEAQKKMTEALMRGEKINPMEANSGMMHPSDDKKTVELLCEKHLLKVIERILEGKYDLVLKEEYKNSLLFTKIPIDDITSLVRQELLAEMPGK